jgi:hypothetical protein
MFVHDVGFDSLKVVPGRAMPRFEISFGFVLSIMSQTGY